MTAETHSQIATFIWSICNLLRGPYKRNEYRKVILPLTVLRRFDCILAPTKSAVLAEHERIKTKSEAIVHAKLTAITKRDFYNLSKLDLPKLLDDPNQLAPNLNAYINGFSKNVRDIIDRFKFGEQIATMAEKNILFEVIKAFVAPKIDLSAERVDNTQMGYVFEELIRIGAEQSNEEAGEHFTPREVIRLMVNLLLSPEQDLGKSHVVKTIYDPACGTGGMLSVAENYIKQLNADADPHLYGQDWNDEAWAVCKADMLIKGEDAENIRLGDTFSLDAFDRDPEGNRYTFDYMLANPPFGVTWKQQEKFIKDEADKLGYEGRFGAGLPRVNDGSLLFLQHMLAKMRPPQEGGSRLGIIFNGSPLFTGDAGSGESEIRRWIIENDWLEAIVALPLNMFYNTGIATYVWVLTNKKPEYRRGKVQLIDATALYQPLRKNFGKKNCELSPEHIRRITQTFLAFEGNERSKIFPNAHFGYRKITIERPLRLAVDLSEEARARFRERCEGAGEAPLADLVDRVADEQGPGPHLDYAAFLKAVEGVAQRGGGKLTAGRRKLLREALVRRDEAAAPVVKKVHGGSPALGGTVADPLHGRYETAPADGDDGSSVVVEYEADPELRDTEQVPLMEEGGVAAFVEREVLPHAPDAWVLAGSEKVGYEINLNRHFYTPKPLRTLEEIRADIDALERETIGLLEQILVETEATR